MVSIATRARGLRAMTVFVLLASVLVAFPASSAPAATDDLFLSEYVEGSSFNKAIEIYNGTGGDVDLSTYTVELYSNGAASPSQSVTLSGTLVDGDVFVMAHASADAAILAETDLISSAVINFNGDDAVVLRNGASVVDAFGQVGFDPGSQWPGGGQDDTLRRNADVCAGDTDETDAFDASVEWTTFPQNTFDGLGAHSANCGGTGNAPVVAACDAPLVTDAGVAATALLSAGDADGTVVDIAASVDPAPGAGSIAIVNLVPAGAVGGTATADLVVEAAVPAGDYAVTVTATNDDATPQNGTCVQSVTVVAPPAFVLIHEIQGSGAASPLVGQRVEFEGVVVGDYEGASPALRGFYVQEEDDQVDGDPATSEGVFVFHGNEDTVDLGDVVRVVGTVAEFQDQTQIGFPESITVVGTGASVTPAAAALPVATDDYLERYEGMLVDFDQTLYVTEFFQLGRFGQVVVSSSERLAQPTAIVEPGAAANAVQAANDLNRLIIDDDLNNQNPDPILFGRGGNPLTAANTLRGGDTVTGVVGVMTYTWSGNAASGNAYRLRPVGDLSDVGLAPGGVVPVFDAANPRPGAAPNVGGSLEVASFNVLNYFVTLDTGVDECGPVGFPQDCRGADDAEEFGRQRDKLLSAIEELDADVLGLIELENSEGVEPLADIVTGLNDSMGAGTYDYIATGTIGSDVIKVGVIYKSSSVTPLGSYAILDSSVNPLFNDDLNRPALAQSFIDDATGEVMTVVVNHLKSKGCGDATGLDEDQGDGAGCYNVARTDAATAEVAWLAGDPTNVGDPDVLVLGDLNSYTMEDPIDVFIAAGYANLIADFGGLDAYSYVFDGQWGYLDYALASPSLTAQVTGTGEYHINADEPSVLDYNTNFKSDGQIISLYAPDEFRTSDHDPVLVGLGLSAVAAAATATPGELWPPNHKYVTVEVTAVDASGDALTVEIIDVTSSEPDSTENGDKPNDIVILGPSTVDLRAERYSAEGRTYTITAWVTTGTGQTQLVTTTVVVPHDQGN